MKKFKKNDFVIVTVGKDRGKTGKIIKIDYMNSQVIVENINTQKKHVKQSQKSSGGIIDITRPIHLSNIKHYSQKNKVSSRVSIITKKKLKVRVLLKTKEEI